LIMSSFVMVAIVLRSLGLPRGLPREGYHPAYAVFAFWSLTAFRA
jgi:hypothetical protein